MQLGQKESLEVYLINLSLGCFLDVALGCVLSFRIQKSMPEG